MSGKKILVGLCLTFIAGVFIRGAFFTTPAAPAKTPAALPAMAGAQPAVVTEVAMNTVTSGPVTPPAPSQARPAIETKSETKPSASGGKETLAPEAVGESDGKETLAPDGKETLGKETLPPVGEQIGRGMDSVDPAHAGGPFEYLNSNPNNPSTTTSLLSPPSPVNVGGPIVSPEVGPIPQ